MQRQFEITESKFLPKGNSTLDAKIQQQVAVAKAKAAAMEIEKRTRLQAAANQAMASGGAATAAQMNPVIGSKYPNLQNPMPAQKPMSDAMQVLTFFVFL